MLASDHDDRAFRRRGIAVITQDEEASVQALLELAPTSRPEFVMPIAFDARAAKSRVVLLAMAALRPTELAGGQPIDVAKLVRERDVNAFRPLFPSGGPPASGPANRLLLAGDGSAAATVRAYIEQYGIDTPTLRAHAIDAITATAILDRDPARGLAQRSKLLAESVQSQGDRMAAWGYTDRPSLEYLMRQAAP
jgi:hypothetical protein